VAGRLTIFCWGGSGGGMPHWGLEPD
jgi:hypothetical protein